nr:hypothetical protein [Clostridia bacterium]
TLLTIRQRYRDMEDDFGLVVAPKYTEEQESYAHVVSIGTSASVTVVPRTASDLDFTGFVLEAMSFESTETLRDSYLKVAFNGKYLRDEDSIEMLDLGIDTRVFDLSIIYTNWGTNWLITLYNVKPGQDFDITSVYASTEEATKTAIENTLELYNALK